MKAVLFTGLSKEEIRDNLEAESIGSENYSFLKPLTENETEDLEGEFVSLQKQIEVKEQEKVRVLEPINEELKEKKKICARIRKDLAAGGIQTVEPVYLMPDYENGVIAFYDENGTLVGSRKMTNAEKQLHINSIKHFKQA